MKSRGLLTASFLLLVLSGTVWWSNKKAAKPDKQPAENTSTKLVSVPEDQFQEIEIKHRAGEIVRLQRNDSKWQITAPKSHPADPDAVSSMLSALSSLSSDRTVEEGATSLDQYGLAHPALELNITDKNNKVTRLLIGDDTPAGTAVYAAVAGGPRVFALSSYKKSSLDKSPNDLRDKRLLNFDSDKLSRVKLSAKKQGIEFGRNKDQWEIVKPKPFRADGFQVDELVRTVRDAKMELSGTDDEKKTATAFNAGSAIATVKVTDVSGTQELQVRKNKDEYYAKSSVTEGVYKIANATATALDKSLDEFRNKKLFDFGYANPDKIEIHDGAKNLVVSRSGTDWLSNGLKMDGPSVTTLIGTIRDLSASKFPDNGFASSMIELIVTSNDGKRIERVNISKNAGRYVAKRENEPALYEVAASPVTELQNAASSLKPADVKPATAPKK